MKRPARKAATDRSFVVALSRGLDVFGALSSQRRASGQSRDAARTNLPKPTISRLTYTLTKLATLPRFRGSRNINSRRQPLALGMPPLQIRRSAFVNSFR